MLLVVEDLVTSIKADVSVSLPSIAALRVSIARRRKVLGLDDYASPTPAMRNEANDPDKMLVHAPYFGWC